MLLLLVLSLLRLEHLEVFSLLKTEPGESLSLVISSIHSYMAFMPCIDNMVMNITHTSSLIRIFSMCSRVSTV